MEYMYELMLMYKRIHMCITIYIYVYNHINICMHKNLLLCIHVDINLQMNMHKKRYLSLSPQISQLLSNQSDFLILLLVQCIRYYPS